MKRKLFLAASLLLYGFAEAFAEENVLNLEKCLQLAMVNNQELKAASERVQSAKYLKLQASGGFFPSVSLTGTWTRLSEVPVIEMASPQLRYYQPADGFVIVGYESVPIEFGGKESMAGRLTLSQSVFTGGKIRNSVRQAAYGYEMAKEEYRRTANNLVFDVKKAFYSVLLAEKFVKISEESRDVLQKHYQVTQSLYREGRVSGYDVSKVKVQLVNSETNVIKSVNNLELAKKFLFNLINQEGEVKGDFKVDSVEPEGLDYYVSEALGNRPEIKQMEYQQKVSGLLVNMSIAQNLPNVSLVGNYDYQKPYYFTNEWTGVLSGMVMLNYPILDGLGVANYAKIRAAKSRQKEVKISAQRVTDGIKLEVERTYLNLMESQKRILAQKENVENAKENLNIAQGRYRLGLISDMEVRDTHLSLTQAEVNYSQSLFDYNVARAELERNIGTSPVGRR